ncbi:hypothetical protein QQS21_011570 [Conoideocrella luteorostrata]|uniref:alpha-1,2-Mannosidase n=1 Tax=Conoideocrella luteorostrata TaxID=1105319 RepID=A0AAJ0CCV1_9HYPO|nr:hypothetical protein QQS21_011570 [Conoideocrella luteorostrata]
MPRRRYRLFTVSAVVIVILLYRVLQNSWEEQQPRSAIGGDPERLRTAPVPSYDKPPSPSREKTQSKGYDIEEPKPYHIAQKVKDEKTAGAQKPVTQPGNGDSEASNEASKEASTGHDSLEHETVGGIPELGSTLNPDTGRLYDHEEEIPLQKPTSDSTTSLRAAPTKVHWKKPKERFPLPKESIITLPTGTAKKIPRIQHVFSTEPEGPKKKRLQRQAAVKEEIQRSWAGYRKYAWMHDELSPVTNLSRDPFCGWAATLVDSLDTLWIAGLRDEFDEAAKAAKNIDFTYTNRLEIPVFETTIRYLGGLIAAYDVSGGASGGYSFLLDKAVELAEILMGIFDTPNRMPLLYYQWRPEYTSQPRRASRAGMAELATLSMEFTRLAQATGQHKYYDAVDRITNGLVDMQKQGTLMPGLFPENLDISGCNATATNERKYMSKAAKEQVDKAGVLPEPEGYKKSDSTPGISDDKRLERRASTPSNQEEIDTALVAGQGRSYKPRRKSQVPLGADGTDAEWDCVPQGFVPGGYGLQNYHMGGGQDSAYEYFGKEYLLLGGREAKYQKLYVDTIDSINKNLLFRPMVPGDWDIVFPAKVGVSQSEDILPQVDYEVTHLTCFIGGMYALGGKLFDREKDLKYAEKLTNGCVWAYQSTATGIMPENGLVVPCPTFEKCSYNESLWWQVLDPLYDTRDQQVLAWEKSEAERERLNREEAELQKAEMANRDKFDGLETGQDVNEALGGEHDSDSSSSSSALVPETAALLNKRAVLPDVAPERTPSRDTNNKQQDVQVNKATDDGYSHLSTKETPPTGTNIQIPVLKEEPGSRPTAQSVPEYRPTRSRWSSRPLTHKEYVQDKIKSGIPPGYSSVSSTKYILRPEAIESVWYMYRITGDPSWMEKGWTMFEATMNATRAPSANSAIYNVLSKESGLLNEMESFWLAETLKYYYLLFSAPDVISLDEWVLNTEAHPFKL